MSDIARCYILRIRDDHVPREELWLVGPFADEEEAGDFGEAHVNDVWQIVYLSDAAVARPLTVLVPEDGMEEPRETTEVMVLRRLDPEGREH